MTPDDIRRLALCDRSNSWPGERALATELRQCIAEKQEATRLLRLLTERIVGTTEAEQSPELADLTIAIEMRYQELERRLAPYNDSGYNPDAHVELRLTIAEIRALDAILARGEKP